MIQLRMSKLRVVLVGGAAAAAFLSAPVLADRDKDERRGGPKIEVKDNGKDYKYEYKDRRCKYEYHLNYRTGEEKIEQKGDCRGVSPRRALYPVEAPIVREERGYEHYAPPTGRRIACNRELIGTVLGGVAGGVAGSH